MEDPSDPRENGAPEGEGDVPDTSIAEMSSSMREKERKNDELAYLRRTAVKAHALHLLPDSPAWRVKFRERVFPARHVEWLIARDEEVKPELMSRLDVFEAFTFLAIFVNLVILAMFDPFDRSLDSPRYQRFFIGEIVLEVFFLIELGSRFIGLGFRHTLSDIMRVADVCVIFIGLGALITQLAGVQNRFYGITIIRTLRLLRPLQRLRKYPSVSVLINSLTRIVYRLKDATLLLLLFLLVFAVASLTQFSGRLSTRCINNVYYNASVLADVNAFYQEYNGHGNVSTAPAPLALKDFVCGGLYDSELFEVIQNHAKRFRATDFEKNLSATLTDPLWKFGIDTLGCSTLQACDNTNSRWLRGYRCPFTYTCDSFENPQGGYLSFDNFGYSLLMMYISTSLQTWYEASYFGADATAFIGVWFMNMYVVVAGILLMNVIIVLIAVEFEKEKRQQRKLAAERHSVGLQASTSRFVSLVQQLVVQRRRAESVKNAENAKSREKEIRSGLWYNRILNYDYSSLLPKSYRLWRQRTEYKLDRLVVSRRWFLYLTSVFILAQAVLLGIVRYGIPEKDLDILNVINIILAIIFTVELLVRYFASNPKEFFQSPENLIDVFVVAMCYIDMMSSSYDMRYVRVFRVVRLGRLLQVIQKLYDWMMYLVKCLFGAPVVLGLLAVVTLIFGIMSLHLFGGRFCGLEKDPDWADNTRPDCPNNPRANFDTFGNAMITTFQILTADDWQFIMFNAMAARGDWACIFFVAYFYIGNTIILSLLIGTMLSVHDDEEATDLVFNKNNANGEGAENNGEGGNDEEMQAREPDLAATAREESNLISQPLLELQDTNVVTRNAFQLEESDEEDVDAELAPRIIDFKRERTEDRLRREEQAVNSQRRTKGSEFQREFGNNAGDGALLRRFKEWSRLKLRPLMDSVIANVIVACVVILQTLTLAFEEVLAPPDSINQHAVRAIQHFCAVFFVLEFILNVLAYGLVRTHSSYLRRSKANIFDTLLMLCGVVVMVLRLTTPNNFAFRYMLATLALRPISVFKHSPHMSSVVSSLALALSHLVWVILAIVLITVFFAIAGTTILYGKLRFCHPQEGFPDSFVNGSTPLLPNSNLSSYAPDVITYKSLSEQECAARGGEWRNSYLNFDNVGESLLSLYLVSTLEQWVNLMYPAMDFSGRGSPPMTNDYQIAALYFIAFAFFGGLFITAVFSAVIVDAYNKSLRSTSARVSLVVNREHNGWLLTNRRILRCLPQANKKRSNTVADAEFEAEDHTAVGNAAHSLRLKMYTLVRSNAFRWLSLLIITANFCFAAAVHYPSSAEFDEALYTSDIVFTALFVAEAILKIIGETPRVYIAAPWNRLDLFVAVVATFLTATQSMYRARLGAMVRSLRILRFGRIIRRWSSVGQLMQQVALALLSLGPVCGVIFVFMVVSGLVTMTLYGRVVWKSFSFTSINHNINFAHITDSLNVLLRVSTGGDWLDVFLAVQPDVEGCTEHLADCGPNVYVTQIFFIIFMVFSIHIFRNLLVAVMLDSFSSAASNRGLRKAQALEFYESWVHRDPELRMSISSFDVLHVLRAIPEDSPLGFNGKPIRLRIRLELKFLSMLKIQHPRRERVKFRAVVDLLCRFAYPVEPPGDRPFVYDFHSPRHKNAQDGLLSTVDIDDGLGHYGVTHTVKIETKTWREKLRDLGRQPRRENEDARALVDAYVPEPQEGDEQIGRAKETSADRRVYRQSAALILISAVVERIRNRAIQREAQDASYTAFRVEQRAPAAKASSRPLARPVPHLDLDGEDDPNPIQLSSPQTKPQPKASSRSRAESQSSAVPMPHKAHQQKPKAPAGDAPPPAASMSRHGAMAGAGFAAESFSDLDSDSDASVESLDLHMKAVASASPPKASPSAPAAAKGGKSPAAPPPKRAPQRVLAKKQPPVRSGMQSQASDRPLGAPPRLRLNPDVVEVDALEDEATGVVIDSTDI